MTEIAMDPAAVRSAGTRLVTAGTSRVALSGAGGAANCGSPIVASAVAEFERELESYISLVGAALAGIGHCTAGAVADMESTEAAVRNIISRLHAELSGISVTAPPAPTPGKKPARAQLKPGYLDSIMHGMQ